MKYPVNYADFKNSLVEEHPNPDWSEALKSLWYDAKGDWEASHNIAQDMHDQMGSWLHAYLHRKEGDEFNAGYWYRQAGRSYPKVSFEAEHRQMVAFVLNKHL